MIDEIKAAIKAIEDFECKYGKPPPFIEVTQEQFDRLKTQCMPFCIEQASETIDSFMGIEVRVK